MGDGRDLEHHVTNLEVDGFRHACAGVVEQREQRLIALPSPCLAIGRGDDRLHLGSGQEPEHRLVMPLLRDGEASLDRRQGREIFVGGVLQERADRRQAGVAASYAALPLALEMIEKGEDQRGVEIGERELGRCLTGSRLRKLQEQPERVAVSRDRVRAHRSVLPQVLGEEALEQHREGRGRVSHDAPPCWPTRTPRTDRPRAPSAPARPADTSRCRPS